MAGDTRLPLGTGNQPLRFFHLARLVRGVRWPQQAEARESGIAPDQRAMLISSLDRRNQKERKRKRESHRWCFVLPRPSLFLLLGGRGFA